MNFSSLIIGFLIGATLGGLIAWLLVRSRALLLGEQVRQSEQQLAQARAELEGKNNLILEASKTIASLEATLEHERKAADEKRALLDRAEEKLTNTFKAISADALQNNAQSFLNLAKTALENYQNQAKSELENKRGAVEHLVTPLQKSLEAMNAQIQELEKTRQNAYGSITTQLTSLIVSQEKLDDKTGKLVQALRTPTVRGQWGQFQLRQVVEIAGMLPYCDFVEQATVDTEDGSLRPDLIVKLPGGKQLVVDAKTPLMAYLEALEADDPKIKGECLKNHAKQVRKHMSDLCGKSYWAQFSPTPEFVFMFIPKESFFMAALEQDPGLIEEGVAKGVILASPITLITLLLTVAHVWRQEKLAEKAQEIADLGRELYDRLRILAKYFAAMGKGLDDAVEAYNEAIGSLEKRFLVTARKFPELGIGAAEEIPTLSPVEKTCRSLQAPELINGSGSAKKKEEKTEN
jgi:DNA recombination protein RmuC